MSSDVEPPNAPGHGSRARTLLVGATWIAVVLLLAGLAARRAPGGAPESWPPEVRTSAPPLARADAGWYRSIAVSGYFLGSDGHGNVVFFPLYPMALRGVSRVTGLEPFRSGMLVSILALLGALLLHRRYAAEENGLEGRALAALLLCPWAFFFVAPYTESLFLLSALGAFLAVRSGNRPVAVFAGLAAGLTRISALALCPALFLESRDRKDPLALSVLLGATPAVGVFAFLGTIGVRFGDPLLFLHAERAGWGRETGGPLATLRSTFTLGLESLRQKGFLHSGRLLDVAVVLVMVAAAIVLFREHRRAEGSFVAATAALVLGSGSLASDGRYAITLFPIFPLVARTVRSRWLLVALLSASGLLEVFLLFRFVAGKWVA